jgi:predicted metal-dependent peptidase
MASVIDKARAHIVLDHPFFASILLRHPMVQNKKIDTLMVAPNGRITYNPDWFETLPVRQAVFALCHEVLHYASMHAFRQGKRDHMKWNYACDGWINDMLNKMSIGEQIPDTVHMPGSSANTVENLYDSLPEGDGDGGGGPPPPGGGNGQGKDPLAGDLEGTGPGMTDSEKSEQEAATKQEVAEAGQAAKMRGNMPAALQEFIAATVDSKVPWYDVLERYMTERMQNDLTWSRPNRRYMPNWYLPVLQSVGAMGEMVVQVDISGSVSRKEIEYYNGHLKRIIEQCNPAKVHVIYTDTEVQHHDEFESDEEVNINFHSGGGTDMRAGFDYIAQKGIEPVCVVTLTDGDTPFPNSTDVPSIWCISSDIKSSVGETIPFSMQD